MKITLEPVLEAQLRHKASKEGKDLSTLITELITCTLQNEPTPSASIIRTERGLTIQGTRITLYDVMDYLLAGCAVDKIQVLLRLTEAQLEAALAYIDTHDIEVVGEYYQVLQQAEKSRQFWETRNRERLAQIHQNPEHEMTAAQQKLQDWKHRLNAHT